MTELELLIHDALDAQVPLRLDRLPAWDDVLARAGVARSPGRVSRRRRHLVFAFAAVVVAVILVGSAIAAALGHSPFGGLSSWLGGNPGTPAPVAEQAGFAERNGASYAAFPANTKLRLLESVTVAGKTFSLLGFRNRSSLCLRLVRADRPAELGSNQCVALRELRRSPAPALVAANAAFPFGGSGTGVDGIFGFADDTVRAIALRRLHGSRQTVRAANNVFVALRRAPFGWDQGLLDGDPIVRVQAIARRGGRLRVPFDGPPPLLKPRVPSYLRQPSTADLPGPAKAQAPLTSPSIAWVLKHEPRGRPFTVPASPPGVPGLGRVLFSRSIQPDPDSPFRVTVALTSGPEHWGSGTLFWGTPSFMNLKAGRLTLCVGGAGPLQGPGGLGGCEQRRWAGSFFPPGHPISIGPTAENPQIQRFSGIAADGVREIDVYLASGRVIPAALRDNVYTVEVPTAQYPAKFVAYDARHRAVMVYVWPDIRPSVLTPCPRATEPGPVRQPKPYERIDLGTGKVNGWQILGKAPSQVEAALGRPAAGHGKASLNAGFLYGGRGDGRFGRPPALIVAFAWYGHQLRADTLWYGGHPDLVDARLGHVLRLQPSELQRRITAAYGSAYRLSVGYGSEPGQFGCTAIFHSRHGRVELSFGVSPWLPTAQGRSRPFLVLRSPY